MPNFRVSESVDIDVDFEVFCSCGAGLCNQSDTGESRRGKYVTVEPCQACLEKHGETEYQRGYEDGELKGHSDGYNKGYDDGVTDGLKGE